MPEPEKKLIEVTVEKRLRVCKEIEATEKEIEFLRRGENPFESEFSEEEMEHGDIECSSLLKLFNAELTAATCTNMSVQYASFSSIPLIPRIPSRWAP